MTLLQDYVSKILLCSK